MQAKTFGVLVAGSLAAAGCGGGGGDEVSDNRAPKVQALCVDTGHGATASARLSASDDATPSDRLGYTIESEPQHGMLDVSPTGEFSYTAFADAPWGRDRFTYRVTDGDGMSSLGEVTLVIRPRIMPLGDSITTGKYDDYDDPDTGGAEPETAGYRLRLWQRLNDAGYAVDFVGTLRNGTPDMDPDHEGLNGFTSAQIAARLPESLQTLAQRDRPQNPDIVLVHAGTNDLNRSDGDDSQLAVQGVRSLLQQLFDWSQSHPGVRVFLARIIGADEQSDSHPKVHNAEVVALNAAIPGLAGEFAALETRVVDQYDALADPDGTPRHALFADRLHPNQAGYDAMADAWYNAISPLLESARCPE